MFDGFVKNVVALMVSLLRLRFAMLGLLIIPQLLTAALYCQHMQDQHAYIHGTVEECTGHRHEDAPCSTCDLFAYVICQTLFCDSGSQLEFGNAAFAKVDVLSCQEISQSQHKYALPRAPPHLFGF